MNQLCANDRSIAEKSYCDQNKALCPVCTTNDCNKADLKKCYSCSDDQCQRTSSKDTTKDCTLDDPCVALFDGCKPFIFLSFSLRMKKGFQFYNFSLTHEKRVLFRSVE